MKEVVYSVKVGTRDALLGRIFYATDRIRNSQRNLERANRAVHIRAAACVAAMTFSTTSFKHRSIQIKGNFTKLTLPLSFKSIIYLNVSCIMLVYYFVPFIVNNRYLLF